MHFVRAEGRRHAEGHDFCDFHGRSHIYECRDRYCGQSTVGAGRPVTIGADVGFDLDLLFCDELKMRPNGYICVQLIEMGGLRRLSFVIDTYAYNALTRELLGTRPWRPLTHDTMAAAITALGGQLEFMEIDKFHPDQHVYEAKLRIRQWNAQLVVDARPSDALVLAIKSNAPIVVSKGVLATTGAIGACVAHYGQA